MIESHPVACPLDVLKALQVLQTAWGGYRPDDNPFDNTGAYFECPTFQVEAFSWVRPGQKWNFRWRDLEVVWYKYLGRDTWLSRDVSAQETDLLLQECMLALAPA